MCIATRSLRCVRHRQSYGVRALPYAALNVPERRFVENTPWYNSPQDGALSCVDIRDVLALNLRRLRQAKGLSQEELAYQATASPSSLACVASTFQGPARGESVKYSDGTIEALAPECRAGDARRRVHLVRKFGEVWRSRVGTMASMRTRMQEMAITGLRHPARAGEVAVVDEAGALGLPIRIEAEDDLDCFFPVRALFVCVEQAQIGGEMPLVIGGQLCAVRRAIFEGGGIHVRETFPRWTFG